MKPKILIVDDSKTARVVVLEALKGFECDLLEASDGAEGLALASREGPQLVLLDVMMPGMTGLEMLSRLKAEPATKALPVIMLTSQANRQTVLKSAQLGVRDFLVKPFSEQALVERVTRLVELRPKGEAPSPPKRFEDALSVVLLDDKPAIHEQFRQALGDTNWQLQTYSQAAEVLEFCAQNLPDVVLVSLALPEGAALGLLQTLRSASRTRKVPVLGLSVKNAKSEQERALQEGFKAIITKPLRADALKAQLCHSLQLDLSPKYLEQRDTLIVIKPPFDASPEAAAEVQRQLRTKVAEAVDAGFDKVVIDLEQAKPSEPDFMKLALSAVQLCQELSMEFRLSAGENVRAECKRQQDSKLWKFSNSVDEAATELMNPTPPS